MRKEIKFDLFQVSVDFYEDSELSTFEEILTNPPANPILLARNGNTFDIYDKVRKRGVLLVGTFCLVQMNELPPKARLGRAPEDLGLDDDSGLGHYTSFIFDPGNNIIAVQSNRQGVSAVGITEYFSRNYRVKNISFDVIIDPADIRRLQNMTDIRQFDVTIAKTKHGNIFDQKKQSIGQLVSATDGSNAGLLKLHLSAGYDKNSSLSLGWIRNMVRGLIGYADGGEVRKVEIRGREEDEDTLHVIDFLENKVKLMVSLPRSRSVSDSFIKATIKEAVNRYTEIKSELDRAYKVKRKN